MYAVVNGRVCIEVPAGTSGAIPAGGSYWLPEREYLKRFREARA
jgi:hypothetical protein